MNRLIKIIRSRYNDLGFIKFIQLAVQSLFKHEVILVYWINNKTADFSSVYLSKNYKVRKGEIADLKNARVNFMPTPWEFMCDVYDNVKDFYIAEADESIEHISWVYYAGHPNRLLKLGANDVEIKYCLTLPQYRGRGIYPVVLKEIVKNLSQFNIFNTFICVKKNNISSIKGIEKAGFEFLKKIRLVKIIGIQITRKQDVRKLKYDKFRDNI